MTVARWICAAVVSAMALSGCSSNSIKGYDPSAENAQVELERALKKMDEDRPAEAIKMLEKILVKAPATEFDFVVLYNLGAARESTKDCKGASENYREVARGSAGKFQRLEAVSLLRLSYAYECMGRDDKVLIALLDTRRRARALPEDTAKAEVPARLAAAYARSGNRAEAEKYFKEALNGIKYLQVKYKDSRGLGDTLAQTLYFMGRSHVSEADFLRNPVGQIKGLELMQLYLLQAAELSSPKWSGRAVDEILGNYARVWRLSEKLDVAQSEDKAIQKQQRQSLRADVLKETLRSVRVLRAQRLPSRIETQDVQRLFNNLESEERKILAVLGDLGVQTPLTPQAEKRQGLKAPGRVKSPSDSILEEEAKKRATLPAKGR
ncbi:MAG: tetratricopeptide repeat protein [Bdellovibrionales bacterium]